MSDFLFKDGKLELDLSKKRERDAAIFLSFSPMSEDHKMYEEALKCFPKIKGLGYKRKAKIIFEIINICEKYNKQRAEIKQFSAAEIDYAPYKKSFESIRKKSKR